MSAVWPRCRVTPLTVRWSERLERSSPAQEVAEAQGEEAGKDFARVHGHCLALRVACTSLCTHVTVRVVE